MSTTRSQHGSSIRAGSLRSPSSAARPLGDPRRYGDWRLFGQLGGGRWTSVFRATPIGSETQTASYALKVPIADFANDPKVISRLCREARAARQISHPHLVPIIVTQLQVSPYSLAMPLLEGANLAELLRHRTAPLAQALWIARQAAEALTAVHAAGWLHGDVKPNNLMIAANGHATLIDLGFARRIDEPANADEAIEGTPGYLPPERLTGEAVSTSGDIYSLGVSLFEMVSRRRPRSLDDVESLGNRYQLAEIAQLRRYSPSLPVKLSRLLRQMLAQQPIRRPSAGEVVERLVALEIEAFAER